MFLTNSYDLSLDGLLCIHIQGLNAHMRFFCQAMIYYTIFVTPERKKQTLYRE